MSTFHILDAPSAEAARAAFDAQRPPVTLGDHAEAARYYQHDEDLIVSVHTALAVGAPLLLVGEPGTGKTQVAYWVKHKLALPDERFFVLPVQSSTTAEDLLYHFDAVRYLHAAHDPAHGTKPLTKEAFVEKGVLWRAFEARGRAIVLLDEIDKAPRDFPNDLLHVLDQHQFRVRETQQVITHDRLRPPPLVVITSNSERRLPEPFLRRCIFHTLVVTEDVLRRAVAARAGDFPDLDDDTREAAIERFLDLRARQLRKRPSLAELLVWLAVLSAVGVKAKKVRTASWGEMPGRSTLLKDQEDLKQLASR